MLSSGILREPCDRVVFETRDVVAGQFRCPTSYPDFRNAGRINHHVVVFPRSAVWIEREHERRFVADPGLATIYNPGQPYERSPISPEGDLADWLGVSERLARDVVRQFDPAHSEQEVPFLHVRAAIGHDVYLAQRTLFTDLVRSDIDALEIEQQVLEILGAVIAAAYRTKNTVNPARPRRGRPRRELVENARAVIAAHLFENLGVCELAAEVGVSPYHLCRAFHAESGMTLHEYRRHIRLRMALGLTAEYRGNLSALALRAGFYSHSHFTTAYRRAFGVSPSEGLPA
jgi:AraC-like DNA-binding protein